MHRVQWECPACGANDLIEMKGGKVKCSYCRAVFKLENAKSVYNRAALPPCPICGSRDPYRKTFTCKECGKTGICSKHTRHGVCSDCYYDRRIKNQLRQDRQNYSNIRHELVVAVTIVMVSVIGIIVAVALSC